MKGKIMKRRQCVEGKGKRALRSSRVLAGGKSGSRDELTHILVTGRLEPPHMTGGQGGEETSRSELSTWKRT